MAHETDHLSASRYQPPEVRRRQILDAAAHLAVEEGLEKTSIAKVADAAGVAKGSIYLHFASRQQLLAGLQSEIWRRMLEKPSQIVGEEGLSWAEKLDSVVEHWMRFEIENHGLYHEVFHVAAPGDDEPLSEARSLLRQLLKAGDEAGEFDIGGLEIEIVLDFLLHAYIGPCFHHGDHVTTIEDVKTLFRRTVGAEH